MEILIDPDKCYYNTKQGNYCGHLCWMKCAETKLDSLEQSPIVFMVNGVTRNEFIKFNKEFCTGCGICIKVCPENAIIEV